LYGVTRAVGGLGTFAAIPIYNFIVANGNTFEYGNIGFAIAIGTIPTKQIIKR